MLHKKTSENNLQMFEFRPVLESQDGHLTISSAKDRNITLKIIGGGFVNVNEINLLHVASAVMNI